MTYSGTNGYSTYGVACAAFPSSSLIPTVWFQLAVWVKVYDAMEARHGDLPRVEKWLIKKQRPEASVAERRVFHTSTTDLDWGPHPDLRLALSSRRPTKHAHRSLLVSIKSNGDFSHDCYAWDKGRTYLVTRPTRHGCACRAPQ